MTKKKDPKRVEAGKRGWLGRQLRLNNNETKRVGNQLKRMSDDPEPSTENPIDRLQVMVQTDLVSARDASSQIYSMGRDKRVINAEYRAEVAAGRLQEYEEREDADIDRGRWKSMNNRAAMLQTAGVEISVDELCNPSLVRLVEGSEKWREKGILKYREKRKEQLRGFADRAEEYLAETDKYLRDQELYELEKDFAYVTMLKAPQLQEVFEADEAKLHLIYNEGDYLEKWAAKMELARYELGYRSKFKALRAEYAGLHKQYKEACKVAANDRAPQKLIREARHDKKSLEDQVYADACTVFNPWKARHYHEYTQADCYFSWPKTQLLKYKFYYEMQALFYRLKTLSRFLFTINTYQVKVGEFTVNEYVNKWYGFIDEYDSWVAKKTKEREEKFWERIFQLGKPIGILRGQTYEWTDDEGVYHGVSDFEYVMDYEAPIYANPESTTSGGEKNMHRMLQMKLDYDRDPDRVLYRARKITRAYERKVA